MQITSDIADADEEEPAKEAKESASTKDKASEAAVEPEDQKSLLDL